MHPQPNDCTPRLSVMRIAFTLLVGLAAAAPACTLGEGDDDSQNDSDLGEVSSETEPGQSHDDDLLETEPLEDLGDTDPLADVYPCDDPFTPDPAEDTLELTCEDLAYELSLSVARGPSIRCTGVLRLSYDHLQPLGYQVFCANFDGPTEEDARTMVAQDLNLAALPGGGEVGELISNPETMVYHQGDELFIFYQAPTDFGHVAVVSSQSGLLLFGGTIVSMGAGGILYPEEWGDAKALGQGCSDPFATTFEQVTSYDLTTSEALPLDSEDEIMAAVMDTVLPAALETGTSGFLKNAVIVLYPRTVNELEPETAEYLVFLNAGY